MLRTSEHGEIQLNIVTIDFVFPSFREYQALATSLYVTAYVI